MPLAYITGIGPTQEKHLVPAYAALAASSIELRSDDGQIGSYQPASRVNTDKRLCRQVDSRNRTVSAVFHRVVLRLQLTNQAGEQQCLTTFRGKN
jgi:hypothetical protein